MHQCGAASCGEFAAFGANRGESEQSSVGGRDSMLICSSTNTTHCSHSCANCVHRDYYYYYHHRHHRRHHHHRRRRRHHHHHHHHPHPIIIIITITIIIIFTGFSSSSSAATPSKNVQLNPPLSLILICCRWGGAIGWTLPPFRLLLARITHRRVTRQASPATRHTSHLLCNHARNSVALLLLK